MANAPHALILDAVKAKIITLIGDNGLDGITAERVVKAWFPDADGLKKRAELTGLPCVLVSPYGTETANPNAGTNLSDDYGYPVPIAIVAATNDSLTQNIDKYLTWRKTLIAGFQNQRLAVDGVVINRSIVKPGQIVDFNLFTATTFWVSYMSIEVQTREQRP